MRVTRVALLFLLLALALLAGHLLPGCDSTAAPAPLTRRQPPLRLSGVWVLAWAGTDYRMILADGGCYEARIDGCLYAGTWSLAGRTLSVTERMVQYQGVAYDGSAMTWVVTLDCGLTGLTGGGVLVSLRR